MKMKYDEREKTAFNEIKFTFIHYVITSISPYYISFLSLHFYTDFFKDEAKIEFDPPKIENKERYLLFLMKIAREVKKYAQKE